MATAKRVTLVPARGRDYKSAKEVRADWDANKDFVVADLEAYGSTTNKEEATVFFPEGTVFLLRYKKLTEMCPAIDPRAKKVST